MHISVSMLYQQPYDFVFQLVGFYFLGVNFKDYSALWSSALDFDASYIHTYIHTHANIDTFSTVEQRLVLQYDRG